MEQIKILSLSGIRTGTAEHKQTSKQLRAQVARLRILADASQAFAQMGQDYQVTLNQAARYIFGVFGDCCAIYPISDDGQWLTPAAVYNPDLDPVKSICTVMTQRILSANVPDLLPQADCMDHPLMPLITREQARTVLRPEIWQPPECCHFHSLIIIPLGDMGLLTLARSRRDRSAYTEDDLRLAQDLADRAASALSNARLFEQIRNELAACRQTVTELTRSNVELEQFAYVASHDLQEPLWAVATMLQLLQQCYRGQLDARANEFIRHAIEGTSRMQSLITDLLILARVSTHSQPFWPVDLSEVLATVRANLAIAIEQSGASIICDRLPTIIADRTQLIQMFQNLLGNAIKFRSDCSPAIHIGVDYQGGETFFTVRDNGIGIEEQNFERIFGMFQRLHTHREYAGTGLGLALCKKIVEHHGGRIWVESEPGRGSTFHISLPDRRNPCDYPAHVQTDGNLAC